MAFKLSLPKLPFSLGALLARRDRGRFDPPSRFDTFRRRLPRLRLPPAFPTALALTVASMVGLAMWLWLNADDTLQQIAAETPQLTLPIAGGTSVAPTKPPEGKTETAAKPAEPPPPPEPPEPPKPPGPPPIIGPAADVVMALAKAPALGLTEDTRNGLLPVIASDGRQPWQVYARPYFSPEKHGRIALVIGLMGVAGGSTGLTLQSLPPGVTLAFVPLAERLEGWVEAARNQGHEVILSVPMEPLAYPHDDPGPNTLLLSQDAAHNLDRLEWALGRFSGYIGITSPTGSKFSGNLNAMHTVLEVLKKRGLMFLDARTAPRSFGIPMAIEFGVPHAQVDRIIDRDPSRAAIDAELRALEAIADQEGVAVGYGEPYPITIERLKKWIPLLADKKLTLVPLSAVINLQKPPETHPPEDEPAAHGAEGKH